MYHAFYALAAHDDIEKFELEDGVVRHAGAALLAETSTIERIIVDAPSERRPEPPADRPAVPWESSITISAREAADCRPPELDELIFDVARVVGAWTVASVDVAEFERDWIGKATPGGKLSFLLRRSAGADQGSYENWLSDAMVECTNRLGDVGGRYVLPLDAFVPGAEFETIASFWFPNDEALKTAMEGDGFGPLLASHLVDHAATRTHFSVEHRLVPNPNAWASTDMAVEPPEPHG
ncbi:MAG: hypothetical protein ACI81L_001535 [Verrucomicrobiales bacterium]|jgi:hypothetical protein